MNAIALLVPFLLAILVPTGVEAEVSGRTIPDLSPSYAEANPGSIWISPDGSGPSLASEGCTVTVYVLDGLEDPIPGYPFQDIYLYDSGTGELRMCQGGSVADANTDAEGRTSLSRALLGGGWTLGGVQVYLSGTPLVGEPLPIEVNSPDLNGDLRVDISDLGTFAGDYAGDFSFRSDFVRDGVLNIADLGVFAARLGVECP